MKWISASVLALAALLLLPSCKSASSSGDLYLTLPFCLDRAMGSAFNIRMDELRNAVESEKQFHACFEELKDVRPEFKATTPQEMDRLDAYLEFAIAASAPDDSFEQTAQLIVARRLDLEITALYFKATSLQKAFEDAGTSLPQQDAEELRVQMDSAKKDLMDAICFRPLGDLKFDAEPLEEVIDAQPPSAEDSLNIPVSKLALQLDDGRNIDLKAAGALVDKLGSSGINKRRILTIVGYKAARAMLNPKSGPQEKFVCATLGKLVREGIARIRLRDAQAEFAQCNAAFTEEAKHGMRVSTVRAIVERDLTLGNYCAAKEGVSDSNGDAMLRNHGIAVIPARKTDEPPDPTLVETAPPPEPVAPQNNAPAASATPAQQPPQQAPVPALVPAPVPAPAPAPAAPAKQ